MMKKNCLAIYLAGCLLVPGLGLRAQFVDQPVIHDTLFSKILNERRPLEIVLPGDYKPDGKGRYDVLYTTDGEYTTKIVSSFDQFLSIQFLPENIVVSIPNTTTNGQRHRERDMLPTHAEGVTESGGAGNFLAFIRDELMPYINQKYRCSGMNTLYGSSYAGVFTMYAFLQEPHLFQSFLLADPAFGWDDWYMIRLAKEKLKTLSFTNTTFLMTGRAGAALQYMGVAKMDSVFLTDAPAGLRWKMNVYSDETHNSMIFRTVYDGLKFTYSGFSHDPLQFYPGAGTVAAGKPIKVFCPDRILFRNMHYTLDGSEPVETSAAVDTDFIVMDKSGKLTVKAICNRPVYSQEASGNFIAGEAETPVALPKKAKSGGWVYSYYEGSWDSLPDWHRLKPVKTGIADSTFDWRKLPRQQGFAVLQTGWIEVKEDGYFLFILRCEGGARMAIGKQTVIDYNGIHANGPVQTYTLPLSKGFYPVRLEYVHKVGEPALEMYYMRPGHGNDEPIGLAVRYGL